MPVHRLRATVGVWQGEFPAFPPAVSIGCGSCVGGWKRKVIQKTLLLPYLQRASKKKVLDLQGATFAQKLSCAQSIFIFSFNLYHTFSLYRSQRWFQLFIYIYMCAYICILYICICACAIWVLMSWWLGQGYVLQAVVVPTLVVCSWGLRVWESLWVPWVSFQSCWRQEVELELSSIDWISERPQTKVRVKRISYDAFLLYSVWYKSSAFVSHLLCIWT